jgi:hypothetical protein
MHDEQFFCTSTTTGSIRALYKRKLPHTVALKVAISCYMVTFLLSTGLVVNWIDRTDHRMDEMPFVDLICQMLYMLVQNH